MKKIFSVILLCILFVALTACNRTEPTENHSTAVPPNGTVSEVTSIPASSNETHTSSTRESSFYDTGAFTSANYEKNIPVTGYEEFGKAIFISRIGNQLWLDVWEAFFVPEITDYSHITATISMYEPILEIRLQKYATDLTEEEQGGSPEGPSMSYTYDFTQNTVHDISYSYFNKRILAEIPEERLKEIGKQVKIMVDESMDVYKEAESVDSFHVAETKMVLQAE